MDKNLWSNLSNEVLTKGLSNSEANMNQRRKKAELEIEIQFGTYSLLKPGDTFGRFGSYVTRNEFNRVMKYFKAISGGNFTENIIEDRLDNDKRKNERVSINKTTNKRTYYDKIKVWNSYSTFFNKRTGQYDSTDSRDSLILAQEYNLRINVSNEFYFKEQSRDFTATIIRNKNRTTFYIDGVGKLDLTEVTAVEINKSSSSQTQYEIELELMDQNVFQNNLEGLRQTCNMIRKVIQDTELPYTNSEKRNMYQYVSKILNLPEGTLKFSMLPEARDLKLEDMVYGGLVGNPETQYCVTFKADGIRRLIVFMPNQIWAIMPGTPDANLIYRFVEIKNGPSIPPYPQGCIVDGELLSKEHRRDKEISKWMFYIFDCLAYENQDIRKLPYYERMMKADQITKFPYEDKVLDRRIIFLVKDYKIISGVNHFFETMNLMFLLEKDLPYINDGLMFIPVKMEYNIYDNPKEEFPPIFQRSLTQYPDICKWKPKEQRSIDFLVEFVIQPNGSRKIQLKTGGKDDKDRTPILFEGSDVYPLMDRIDKDHPILSNLPSHSIVEFAWEEKTQQLKPLRVRLDKTSPNRYFTAMDVWKNIFSGIDKDTLTGNTFQLMRAYHNKIKLELYQNVKPTRNHRVLLDIGSGRGGDLKKWNQFEKIFAVEPNKEHLEDLKVRLNSFGLREKVKLIQTGGEDYETITNVIQRDYGEKVSTVSIMLSMSFFHGKAREGLKKTIENNLELGGEVLVFTINGDLVQEMFEPSSGEYKKDNIRFLNAETTYDSKTGTLWIDIPSTIVSEQEEHPPKLSELFREWDNFLPLNVSRADKQNFLNLDEKAFSNMYTSFKMILMSGKRSEIEVERIVPYARMDLGYSNLYEDFDLYGISVLPSDYFYLSAILKATNEEYQNDNRLTFRREMVLNVWDEIESELSREQKQRYQFPWNDSVLELFSKVFDIGILAIQEGRKRIFGIEKQRKIIIIGEYILAHRRNDEKGLFETVF